MRMLLAVFELILLTSLIAHAQHDELLPRRGLLGAQLAEVTPEVRKRSGLTSDKGVVLTKVFPDTAAAEAGLKVDDVILSVDAVAVSNPADFLEALSRHRAGDAVLLAVVRDGKTLEQRATLKETARERDSAFDITYGHVVSKGVRLRTIMTRTKTEGSHPAVLFLQGHGNHSIDRPFALSGFTRLAHHLTRNGYITLRVDRRGCGDSEGAPCSDMDFETELDGYRQALKALKTLDFVDKSNVFIFGQSLGGITGPIIASESPVRGIITHGTGAGIWFHQILSQRRRWAEFDGSNPADVAERIRRETRFWYPLVVEKQTPDEILKNDPENRETILNLSDGKLQCFNKPCTWLHQAVEYNLGEIWLSVASTPLTPQ